MNELGEEVPNPQTCWELLERVAESSHLRRSVRLQRLLFYVGKRSLREGCNEIREHEIGVEVYGRPTGYDTNIDNIVRVNASELRKRLAAYFEEEGQNEPLWMNLPRGRYVPVFRQRAAITQPPQLVADLPRMQPNLDSTGASVSVANISDSFPDGPSTRTWVNLLSTVGIAALVIACSSLWIANRNLNRKLNPLNDNPILADLWTKVVQDNHDTDIVMEDSSFLLAQNIDKKTYSFDEYLRREYLDTPQSSQLSQDVRRIKMGIGGKTLTRAAEVRLVQKILALNPTDKNIHIYNAREYTSTLFTRDNVIVLSNPTTNPWAGLLQDRLNFRQQPESGSESPIVNRSPSVHEQAVYIPATPQGVSYCVIASLPKSDGTNIILIEGTASEATEACGNYILSEDQLSGLKKVMGAQVLSSFEVLMKVQHVTGMPITATIEGYRRYPNTP